MVKIFEGITGGNEGVFNPTEVLNKLLETKDIEIKTDFSSMQQIKILVSIKYYSELFAGKDAIVALESALQEYKVLLCSYQRQSRREITEAVKEIGKYQEQQGSMISGMQGIR